MDAIKIERAQDSGTTVSYVQIYTGYGTLGTPTATQFGGSVVDQDVNIDQALALELGIDIRETDRVISSRGTFTVLAVAQHRLHQRAALRRL